MLFIVSVLFFLKSVYVKTIKILYSLIHLLITQLVNPISKSYLIVKDDHLLKAHDIFKHYNVTITSTGQRHLGAVIGSLNYKKGFAMKKLIR